MAFTTAFSLAYLVSGTNNVNKPEIGYEVTKHHKMGLMK
jgi:hypothetical protein